MVNVELNVKGAQLMLTIFKDVKGGREIDEDKVESLLKLEVIDHMVKHYNRSDGSNAKITKEDFKKVMMSLDHKEFKDDSTFLINMHQNYREKLENLDVYEKTLKRIQKSEINQKAEQKLARYLPENSNYNSRAYIIFTGHSGGYFHGDDLTMDLGFISDGHPDKFIDVISHELHHIGFNKIGESLYDMEDLEVQQQILISLVGGLVGEGTAYYCMGGIPEKGQEGYEDYIEDTKKEKEHFREINNAFKAIITGEMKEMDAFMAWASDHMRHRFGAINYIGIKTMEAINKAYGSEGVVYVMEHLEDYITKYNEAATRLNNEGQDYFLFEEEVEIGIKKALIINKGDF